jgi:Holliday junction resolvase RusA-like endonuclease
MEMEFPQGIEKGAQGCASVDLRFFVPGTPAPGGSKTGFYNKKLGRVMMTPASKKTKPWMSTVSAVVRSQYHNRPLLTDPLRLGMQFRILRPKGHWGSGRNAATLKQSAPTHPTVKPDLTKLVRATEDALTGVLWRDDTQVVAGIYSKIYVERDPGVVIQVSRIPHIEIEDSFF